MLIRGIGVGTLKKESEKQGQEDIANAIEVAGAFYREGGPWANAAECANETSTSGTECKRSEGILQRSEEQSKNFNFNHYINHLPRFNPSKCRKRRFCNPHFPSIII